MGWLWQSVTLVGDRLPKRYPQFLGSLQVVDLFHVVRENLESHFPSSHPAPFSSERLTPSPFEGSKDGFYDAAQMVNRHPSVIIGGILCKGYLPLC